MLNLPEDLLLKILSRVPIVSLSRLRSTSKGWNTLIKDVILPKKSMTICMLIEYRVCLVSVDLHGEDKVVKITSQFSLKDPTSNEEVCIREVFHCDGLLLCITQDNRLVVWNPCSGDTRWIKQTSSHKKQVYYALGKSCCNEYKILMVNQHRHDDWIDPRLVEYEVYDFTSKSWRIVGETRDWFIPEIFRHGTTVNGNTYWLGFRYNYQDQRKRNILLRFDFSTERFEVLNHTADHLPYNCVRALSVTGDHQDQQQLCLLASQAPESSKVDVWLAATESNGASTSWRKLLSVESAIAHQLFRLCDVMNFLIYQEDKVLVSCGLHGLFNVFLHVLGEDKIITLDYHAAESYCSPLFSYVLPTSARIQ